MFSIKIADTAASTVTEVTLRHAPARMLTFLLGARDKAIRTKFQVLNWSEDRAKEGWALLDELKAANIVTPVPPEDAGAEAIAACEAWQSGGLVRARAMLTVTHPEQARFLFHDFVPGKGMVAVLNVSTILQRLELLAHDASRKASRKADAEALAVIEHTGVTKETIKDLEAMVASAQEVPEPLDAESVDRELDAARLEALRKIHAWTTAWSDMARTVITRRDQMIKLGIAKRRPRKPTAVVTPPVVTPPAATTPVLTPPVAADDNGPESRAA